jgi:hypothetical protein
MESSGVPSYFDAGIMRPGDSERIFAGLLGNEYKESPEGNSNDFDLPSRTLQPRCIDTYKPCPGTLASEPSAAAVTAKCEPSALLLKDGEGCGGV